MALVVQEFAPVLDTRAPCLVPTPGHFTIHDVPGELSLEWLVVKSISDNPLGKLALFCDWDGPVASAMLRSLEELTLEHTAIDADHFTLTFRHPVTEVSNVAATLGECLDSSAVLVAIFEQALVDVTAVRSQNAVAPRLVVRPHT